MNDENPFTALWLLRDAETNNLRDLAHLLGEDPATFYIATDLSGVDIRGQDLRGMDFSRTNVENAIFDSTSKFDGDLQEYLDGRLQKRYLEVSSQLLGFVEEFFSKDIYPSRGWFIKAIVPDAARAIAEDPEGWLRTIKSSKFLTGFFRSTERERIELLLSVGDYKYGQNIGSEFRGRGSALTTLIIVGLLRLIGFDPKTDKAVPSSSKWLAEYNAFPQNHRKHKNSKARISSRKMRLRIDLR